MKHKTALRGVLRASLRPVCHQGAKVVLAFKGHLVGAFQGIVFVVLADAIGISTIRQFRASGVDLFLAAIESIVQSLKLRIIVLVGLFEGNLRFILGGVAEERVILVHSVFGFEAAGDELGGREEVDHAIFLAVHL